MIKKMFFATAITLMLLTSGCSGDDNSTDTTNTTDTTAQLVGKWVIYKAKYSGSDPVTYTINGECGREVLEFTVDKTVQENLYQTSDCTNGAGTEWQWWTVSSGKYGMGYSNSDADKLIAINGNELTVDAQENWGYIKYYKKVN